LRVLDVGGGKHPAISLQTKQDLGLHIVGLDISDVELLQAPAGAYDHIVVGDVATVNIPGQYDLIFSRSVIEHVQDPASAIENLSRVLAPGGTMAHFMPCRNAPFAIINRVLGNRVARQVLFTLFPDKRHDSGFQAFYNHCTPTELAALIGGRGLEVVKVIPYYKSDYASFFAPFYTLEMLRQALMCYLDWQNYAETFSIVVRNSRAAVSATGRGELTL
jgi:2-polyprenyl-6-hydroxyphenyl methylase/3-demethylubiquinone-9 3-methyltransferase